MSMPDPLKYKTAEDMLKVQKWWDERWLLPHESDHLLIAVLLFGVGLFFSIGLMTYSSSFVMGGTMLTVVILLFGGWLLWKRYERNRLYIETVLFWIKYRNEEFQRLVVVYNFDPREHSGWPRYGEMAKETGSLIEAIKTVNGVH